MASATPPLLFDDPVESKGTPPLLFDEPEALPPSTRYDSDSNSSVLTPQAFTSQSVSRESMEFIEGQNGEQIYGGTNYLGFADFAEVGDIKKILAGASPIVSGVTGKIESKIERGRERRPLRQGSSQEDIEAFDEAIPTFLSGLVDLIIPGQKKAGFQKMMEGVANFRQFAPFSLGFMSDERGLSPIEAMVQDNPEKAARLQAASKKARENTDEFLIEHGIMFGPDDAPTLVGTILQQASLTGSIMAVGWTSKSPALVMGLGFGGIQQGEGFLEAREAGKGVFEAATIGDIQGSIEFAMSSIEMGMVMKIVDNKSAGIAKKIAAGFVGEAAQESTTDTFLLAVSNLAGVKNMTLEQALQAVIQAGFYGGFAGGISTGGIASVQRIAEKIQASIDTEVALIEDPADVPDRTGQPLFDFLQVLEEAVAELDDQVSEQYISDIETENQIDDDKQSDQPVTKSATSKKESQAKVAEIINKIEQGEEFDVQEELDKLNPEAKKQRDRNMLRDREAKKAQAVETKTLRDTVEDIHTEIEIAEQEGDETRQEELLEELERVRNFATQEGTLRETVEALESEGLFVRGEDTFNEALEAVDSLSDVAFEKGVKTGESLKATEIKAIQKGLKKLVSLLGKHVTPLKKAALNAQITNATSPKTMETVRSKIIAQARRSALARFVSERRKAITKRLIAVAKKKPRADLAADYQNSIDSLNKMRKGMDAASKIAEEDRAQPLEGEVVEPDKKTESQKKADKETRERQVNEFTDATRTRLMVEMDNGIPNEGLMLQVRYLKILLQKSKVTAQELAKFEDDLNAFIATGEGLATDADTRNQEIMDDTKDQAFSNTTQANRAELENSTLVKIDEEFGWWAWTLNLAVKVLGLKGTVFDFFDNAVSERNERLRRNEEFNSLFQEVAGDRGITYRNELEKSKETVIDVPREGNTSIEGGGQKKRMKMTRGEMIYSWMLLKEESVRNQLMDEDGVMGWTDEFVAKINATMTEQDRLFAEGLFEIYNRSYERLNEVYRRVYNRDLKKVEFYSSITREGSESIDSSVHNQTMFYDLIFDEEAGTSHLFPSTPSQIKERKSDSSREIIINNAVSSYRRYVWDTEHFIAYAEQLRLANKLLLDKDFVKHLKFILSEGGFRNFVAHLQVEARSNVAAGKTNTLFRDMSEFFRSNLFKGALLLNPKIGVGQTASALASKAFMPSASWAKGIADFAANPKKANDILNQHPTFKDRSLNFSPEIDQLDKRGELFDIMSLPTRLGDAFGAKSSAWAYYLYLTDEKGVAPKDALQTVAEFAEESQQSTLTVMKTLSQKSDDILVRSMMMFRSSLVSMMNVSMASIDEYKKADKSTPAKKAEARKHLIEMIAIQNIAIPALYATLTGRPLTTALAVGSLAALPGVSELLEMVGGVIANLFRDEDEKVYINGPLSSLPIAEGIDATYEAIYNMQNGIEQDFWEELHEAVTNPMENVDYFRGIANIIDILTPFPEAKAVNMLEGAMELFDTDDPIDAALQLGGYTDNQRRRMIERFDFITGADSETDKSGSISQPVGAF